MNNTDKENGVQVNTYYEMFQQCKLERDLLKAELEKARELIRSQNDILCAVYTENSATVIKAKEFLKKEGEKEMEDEGK